MVLSQLVVGGASVEWRMEMENMADGVENGTVNGLWWGSVWRSRAIWTMALCKALTPRRPMDPTGTSTSARTIT
ncbi:hypothetical protein GOP47_0010567 [Adiantum capillus-veneris]|uniref:Uncharacterized protein n=1 Tax=Adiantum capillus-veneris TaxID=13818 RepID=A0A9D4ZIV6_ADICA|nr:hypothetical protein GOP47_0010567 [Adiantum capillus-veneris]